MSLSIAEYMPIQFYYLAFAGAEKNYFRQKLATSVAFLYENSHTVDGDG